MQLYFLPQKVGGPTRLQLCFTKKPPRFIQNPPARVMRAAALTPAHEDDNVELTRVYFFRPAQGRLCLRGTRQTSAPAALPGSAGGGGLLHPFKSLFSMGILLEQGPGITVSPLPPRHLRRPIPSGGQPGLLPSLEMAPARSAPLARLLPPRSALKQHGVALTARLLALIKHGGSRSLCPVPALRAPRAGFSGFSPPGAKMAEAIAGV